MKEQKSGIVPIVDARRISQKSNAPVVCVFALHPTGNRFTVTTYGQTKRLCKLAASYGEQICQAVFDGRVEAPNCEPDDSVFDQMYSTNARSPGDDDARK